MAHRSFFALLRTFVLPCWMSSVLLAGCGESSVPGDTTAPRDDAGAGGRDSPHDDDGEPDDDAPPLLGTVVEMIPVPTGDDDDGSSGAPSEPPEEMPDGEGGSASDSPSDAPSLPLPLRYVSSATDTRLLIEVDSVPGMQPRSQSEVDLIERFEALLDKPDGIEIEHDDTLDAVGEDYVWTREELFDLAPSVFDDDEPSGTVSLHVMFLDGSYESEDGGEILGVAWGNRHIAMFSQVINLSCSTVPLLGTLEEDACRAVEFGVWSHEVGHVIGLVNNGLAMQSDHEDAEHPHHDVEPGCLMYWAYDGPSFGEATLSRLMAGDDEIDFCQASLDDLANARASVRP